MPDPTAIKTALEFYAGIGAALFPIPAGQKNPTGIVGSFAQDCSRDPAQWAKWAAENPGCNFGIVAGPSRLIIVDIDTSGNRDEAWTLWCGLCAEWGVPVTMPDVQSARGGWHVYFAVPETVDAATLRQPDAIKKRINVRAGNGYTVAAGSFYDGTAKGEASGPYVLLQSVRPPLAPDALIRHCTRSSARTATAPTGSRDIGDTAALVTWLAEREAFAAYEDWVSVGMALKLEFGDAGLDVWQLAHDQTVTADVEQTKWQSFASEPTAGVQTLNTWLDRAHKLGWKGTVRKSAAALFGGVGQVAAIAQAAGASLAGATLAGMPMLAGQEKLCEEGAPILAEFMANTADSPFRPAATDYPTMPESMQGHGLYEPLRDVVARVIAMAEERKGWKANRVVDALAVLSIVHVDTFEAVCRRIRTHGCTVPESKIKRAAANLSDKVERAFVSLDSWHVDAKGYPEGDNSDNVAVLLGIVSAEVRWNAWLEKAEIKGGVGVTAAPVEWPEWTYIDDAAVAKLRTRANRTKTRFRPAKEFFWESLTALAHSLPFDPVLTRLDELAKAWDGTPRLAVWLSYACGVPCDPYHQAVGRNIIGGMVRRARRPGCKHDTMPVFFGPQGTGKSTLAAILADMGQSTLAQIHVGGGQNFTDTVRLGDEAKELVLSLAGKTVAEIGEMGTRSGVNANHIKAMISRQTDSGRTAYARAVTERPRRNVFIGTTNEDEPLIDPTGNRRFLPVRVDQEIKLAWLCDNVAQLVGEAARLEAAGVSFELPREVWRDAAEYQEAARSASDIETLLSDWFAPSDMAGPITYILASDLIALEKSAGIRNATSQRGALMKAMGFKSEKPHVGGKRTTVWVRGITARHSIADIPRIATRYAVAEVNGRAVVRLQAPGSI